MAVKQKEKIISREQVKIPKMYCCVIHNDDITTMDFVVMSIVKVFNKSSYEASKIMMHIHKHGKGRVGFYCYDIAVTKKLAMDALAGAYNFPLITIVEEAEHETR